MTLYLLLFALIICLVCLARCYWYIGKLERDRYIVNHTADQFLIDQCEKFRTLYQDLLSKQPKRASNGKFTK
jgi:hypothetical protein